MAMDNWKAYASGEVFVKDVLRSKRRGGEGQQQTLIMVQETETVAEALDRLMKHCISSAPVLSQKGIKGFIDVLDLLAFAMRELKDRGHAPRDDQFIGSINATIVGSLLNASGRDEFHSVSPNSHLYQLIQILSKAGVHRVLVEQLHNRCLYTGLLTQSDLAQWLYDNRDKAGPLMHTPVRELWPASEGNSIVCVNYKQSLYEAFSKMVEQEVSAVAVVDNKGSLVANLSASDIKYLGMMSTATNQRNLYEFVHALKGLSSVGEYFQLGEVMPVEEAPECPAVAASFTHFQEHSNKKPREAHQPVCVTEEDTLEKVMELLVHSKQPFNNRAPIHRVYVVSDRTNRLPTRVVSLTDLIKVFHIYP